MDLRTSKTLSHCKPKPLGGRKKVRLEQQVANVGMKGSRGTVYDKDFDNLEKTRVPRASSVTSSSRNRRPEDLGLKQWDGK